MRVRFDVGLGNRAPDRAEFFYAKCGCFADPALGELFDPNAPGPQPNVATDLDFKQLMIEAEYAVGRRFAVFGELPLRWITPQAFLLPVAGFEGQGGLGDLRVGAKAALAASLDHALTARVQFYFPTGDAGEGLGTDHTSIEPSLLHLYRHDRFAIESQFGFWLPVGGADQDRPTVDDGYSGNVMIYGIGPSYTVYDNGTVALAPVVELFGWHVMSGFHAPDASGGGLDASGTNREPEGRPSYERAEGLVLRRLRARPHRRLLVRRHRPAGVPVFVLSAGRCGHEGQPPQSWRRGLSPAPRR